MHAGGPRIWRGGKGPKVQKVANKTRNNFVYFVYGFAACGFAALPQKTESAGPRSKQGLNKIRGQSTRPSKYQDEVIRYSGVLIMAVLAAPQSWNKRLGYMR